MAHPAFKVAVGELASLTDADDDDAVSFEEFRALHVRVRVPAFGMDVCVYLCVCVGVPLSGSWSRCR